MLSIRTYARLIRPIYLILSALTYTLGAGIARYLGRLVHPASFALGLMAVLLVEAAAFWLVEYFHLPMTPLSKGETPRYRQTFQASLFQLAIAFLTVAGAIFLTLLITQLITVSAVIILILIVIFYSAYAIPPLRVSETGYGALVLAVGIGTLTPTLAFLLQFGEYHRLLTFATFPLTLLALAFILVNDFPTFATDQKYDRHTLLTRLTWQRAIPTHHILILASFLFFAITPIFGIPWGLVWPVFLAMPFAVIQIIWLQRIVSGGRTLWNYLTVLSVATFSLTVYFLAMTFWFR